MRFATPFSQSRGFRLSRNVTDWPMAMRFALLVLPAGLCIALTATWLGYRAAYGPLMTSLESLPLLEAKTQATDIATMLTQMRHSLFSIAQSPRITAQGIRDSLVPIFHNNVELIQEFSYKDAAGEGFLLLRDNGSYKELGFMEASTGPYSPFQQLATLSPQADSVTLYPPVYFDDPSSTGQDHAARVPVMRMAFTLKDNGGTLIIGISIEELRNRLAHSMRADSPLRLPSQDNIQLLSFYFDARGWILFEMDSGGRKSFAPDLAREGYGGDLGRAGLDTAFRPWTIHENYWRMVTDVAEGHSGSIPAPADKYSNAQFGGTGFLCYAPVLFAPNADTEPYPIGGIAFFETSKLPLASFLRLANYSLGIIVAALLLFGLMAYKVGKTLAFPIRRMAKELGNMSEGGELLFLNHQAYCEEQQQFQAAVNGIIANSISAQGDLSRLRHEIQQTRSRLPVDLRQALPPQEPEAEFGLVGSSALIREVRDHVRTAARAGTDVLIWGETGTGKELVAAAIHKASARSEGPYVSINCGALDENLLLDALFGHTKGAFTEAKTDRKGAFLAAEGGTLHLDEIANASLKVQQALLRALSVRRVRPLGSDNEVPFNTRVVAATNVDLRECVRAGEFREDLYYRLAIISIETPPLRHRKEDIPGLAAFCIHEAAQSLGRPEAKLSRGALDLMTSYDWPGNVREFKNCITRAMAYVEGDLILRQHITLEQDAFQTYSKPLSPLILAEKIHPGGDPGRIGTRRFFPPPAQGNGNFAPYDNPPDTPQDEQRPPRRNGHAAEHLWPAPPREAFTPARPNGNQHEPASSPDDDPGQEQQALPAEKANALSLQAVPPPENAKGRLRQESAFPPPAPYPGQAHMQTPAPSHLPYHTPSGPASPPRRQDGLFRVPAGEAAFAAPLPETHPQGAPPRSPSASQSALPLQGLNERQLRAIDLVRERREITRAQYEEVSGQDVSPRTLQNDLRELVERDIFRRVGAGPGTRYVAGKNL